MWLSLSASFRIRHKFYTLPGAHHQDLPDEAEDGKFNSIHSISREWLYPKMSNRVVCSVCYESAPECQACDDTHSNTNNLTVLTPREFYACPQCQAVTCTSCLSKWFTEHDACLCINKCPISIEHMKGLQHGAFYAKWEATAIKSIVDFHTRLLHTRTSYLATYKKVVEMKQRLLDLKNQWERALSHSFEGTGPGENSFSKHIVPWCRCQACTAQHNHLCRQLSTISVRDSLMEIICHPWGCENLPNHTDIDNVLCIKIGDFGIMEWMTGCLLHLQHAEWFRHSSMDSSFNLSSQHPLWDLAIYTCLKDVYQHVLQLHNGKTQAAQTFWGTHAQFLQTSNRLYSTMCTAMQMGIESTLGRTRTQTYEHESVSRKVVRCSSCGEVVRRDTSAPRELAFHCAACSNTTHTYVAYVEAGYHPRTALSFVANTVSSKCPMQIQDLSYSAQQAWNQGNHMWMTKLSIMLSVASAATQVWHRLGDIHNESHQIRQTILDIQMSQYRISWNDQRDQRDQLAFSKKPYFSVIRCDRSECNGLVDFGSTDSACITCQTEHCNACWKPTSEGQDAHICDTTHVEHVACVSKACLQCPACRTIIQKVQGGCSHMYCTHCHTGWNDRTQEILHGIVMNPHFFEDIDKQHSQQTADVPGYTFHPPPSDWATQERMADHKHIRAATYVYWGVCAFMHNAVLAYYNGVSAQRFQDKVRLAYPILHKLNRLFSVTREDKQEWASMDGQFAEIVKWARKVFLTDSRTKHKFYTRMMFDWQRV